MAKLILFHNSQEDIVIDKIDKLDYITTVNGKFKDEVDLSAPIITLSLNVKDVSRVNYIYIEDFDRFYFVDNVVIYSDVFEFYLSVDVLTTFRGDIYRTECVISRNNFINGLDVKNNYIIDNRNILYEDYEIIDVNIDSPVLGNNYGSYIVSGYDIYDKRRT